MPSSRPGRPPCRAPGRCRHEPRTARCRGAPRRAQSAPPLGSVTLGASTCGTGTGNGATVGTGTGSEGADGSWTGADGTCTWTGPTWTDGVCAAAAAATEKVSPTTSAPKLRIIAR